MPTNNEFLEDIAREVAGTGVDEINIKFGRNSAIGTTEIVVQDLGGSFADVTTADVVSVVSDSANDVDAGTGAWTISVTGLDANWDAQTEVLTLAGLTPVVSTNTFIRVFRMQIETAGTLKKADGNITASIDGTDVAQIQDGDNQTLMANYTVPRGKKLELLRGWYSLGSGKSAVIRFKAWDRTTANSVPKTKFAVDGYQNAVEFTFPAGVIYQEKTDVFVTAIASGVGTPVSCAFLYNLTDA